MLKWAERRSYHASSLHVAALGTVQERRVVDNYTKISLSQGLEATVLEWGSGRSYHTSLHLPDKKAKVEKAVDTIKEKKKSAKVMFSPPLNLLTH